MTMVTLKTGRKHGPASKTPFDGWYRYPAGFSSDTLDACFEVVGNSPRGPVLDPFAGIGTVGTRAAVEGRDFVGIETHPLIAEIARRKLNYPEPPSGLLAAVERVVAAAVPITSSGEAELVTRSFSPPILAELVGLRVAIAKEPEPWSAYLEIALLSLLRDHAEVKVGWPYQLPAKKREPRLTNPRRRLVELTERMVSDMTDAGRNRALVVTADARAAPAWRSVCRRAPTSLISSPPYLNNFDYADATRLELYFSKRASSWAEMCTSVRSGMIVASTQQSTKGAAERATRQLEKVDGFYAKLSPLIASLKEQRDHRPGGAKRYDWMVTLYFRDLLRTLGHAKKALPRGAPLVWVIGDSAPYSVYLDTPWLLGLLGKELGFTVSSEEVIRSRGARWRTNGSRHQVDLCEKLVVWKAPGPG